MAPQTIVFRSQQDGEPVEHEAVVSDVPWPRSLIGAGYLVVEHSSTSYVVAITAENEFAEFVAYPILEST